MNVLWLNYKLHNTISQHALDLIGQNLHIYILLNLISKKILYRYYLTSYKDSTYTGFNELYFLVLFS